MLLSLGICSIAFILKRKRILYLHSLLKKDPSSLASKVFLQMIKKPLNSDWINIVKNDLKDFNMHLTFDQISNIPKEKFKAIVRDACKKACFHSLLLEREKLSKGKEICFEKLQMQHYLSSDSSLSITSMRKIFHIQTREIFLKCNFPNLFKDTNCVAAPLCREKDENSHIFICSYLMKRNELSITNLQYCEIFSSNISTQELIANIIFTRLEVRNSLQGTQSDPRVLQSDPRIKKLGIRGTKLKPNTIKSKIPTQKNRIRKDLFLFYFRFHMIIEIHPLIWLK